MNDRFPRPRIVLSRCLGVEACRFDGGMITSEPVERLRPFADFLPVCAEKEIGLGVPRRPIRLVGAGKAVRLVQPATGLDVTGKMRDFCARHLSGLADIDGFILKSRSPSCGVRDVKRYSKAEGGAALETSPGLFGEAALEAFPLSAVEDEDRLRNARIRDQFLTKVFALARFRDVRRAGDINALIAFQSDNKHLLLAYSPRRLKAMGRLVAGQKGRPPGALLDEYGRELSLALTKGPTYRAYINFLQHAFGYVSEKLSGPERDLFLDTLELYKEDRAPLASPMSLLRAWAVRFDVGYLERQTIFEPYPRELVPEGDTSREKDFWK